MPRSRLPLKSLCKIYFHLHGRMASPPERDIAIAYPRSRVEGLEIFHRNTLSMNERMHARSSPARRARKFPCKDEVKFSPLTWAIPTKRVGLFPGKHPQSEI